MTSGMLTDTTFYKSQQVLVYSPTGSFLGTWWDAPLLSSIKFSINSATTPWVCKLPRTLRNYNSDGTIAAQNIVNVYLFGPGLPSTGLLKFAGKIDAIKPSLQATGEEAVEVTVTSYDSAIADQGITGSQTYAAGTDPLFMMSQNISSPLSADGTNPTSSGNTASYTFVAQTMKSIYDTCLLMLPANWFYRCNPLPASSYPYGASVTINVPPVTAQNTFIIGNDVSSTTLPVDSTQLKNEIYVIGTGTNINAYVTGSDISTYGARIYYKNDPRLTTVAQATTIANGLLTFYDRALYRTTVRVIDYRGSIGAGVGYDIETIKPGQSCQIIDPTLSPEFVSTVMPIVSVSYNFDSIDIECGSRQPRIDGALAQLEAQFSDYTM